MSISSQNSEISLAVQAAKIGRGGTYTVGNYDYESILAAEVAMGPVDDVQTIPLRVGGPMGTTGAFKQSTAYVGGFSWYPSPRSTLGWLLLGLMGEVTTTADTPVAGAHTHKFSLNGNGASLPWMTFRAKIPKNGGYYAETGFDCRLESMALNVPNQGLLSAEFGLMGRDFIFGDGSGWSYTNTDFDPANLLPKGHQTVAKIAGTEYQILSAQIQWANQFTGPRQETVIGYPKMLDITKTAHVCSIRLLELWDSDGLRRNIFTNSPSGTNWSGNVFQTTTSVVGTSDAFRLTYTSEDFITGSTPYKLEFVADQVNWRLGRQLPLQGGALIAQEIIGVIVEPSNPAHEYAYFNLVNGKTGYVP